MKITPVIQTYNNPHVLPRTLAHLEMHGFGPSSICILDNGSRRADAEQVQIFCAQNHVHLISYQENHGAWWGLNKFLDESSRDLGDILLIMAHDALVLEFNKSKILSLFEDELTCFVTPQYPKPLKVTYNFLRSYRAEPGVVTGRVRIGNFTAACIRKSMLIDLRFDEEFFLYGGEFDIFLRAADCGFRNYVEPSFIVENPSTDASSDYGLKMNTINSLYLARKRHGVIGYIVRLLWISLVILKSLLTRSSTHQVLILLDSINFSLRNAGMGYMTYHNLRKHSPEP
jgi:GT2 family glycosyltransferase